MIVGPLLFLLDVCRLGHSLSAYFSNVTLVLFGSSFISIDSWSHGGSLNGFLARVLFPIRVTIRGIMDRGLNSGGAP